jgi:hypothetical protein
MANIATQGVMMKEKPNVVSLNSKKIVPILKSLFIDLYDSSNGDGLSFLM